MIPVPAAAGKNIKNAVLSSPRLLHQRNSPDKDQDDGSGMEDVSAKKSLQSKG
jgi:hypothetical protein